MIRHVQRWSAIHARRLNADLREPLMDVFYLRVPQLRALEIVRVVFEQMGVVLEVRTTAARVRDDGIEFFWRELVDVLTRQFLRQFPFAIVRVKRAAAMLFRRR